MKAKRPKIQPENMTYVEIAEYYVTNFKAHGLRTEDFCERNNISYSSFTKITNKNYGNNFPVEMIKLFAKEARDKGMSNPYLYQEKVAREVGGIFVPPEVLEKVRGEGGTEMIEVLTYFIDMIRNLEG